MRLKNLNRKNDRTITSKRAIGGCKECKHALILLSIDTKPTSVFQEN